MNKALRDQLLEEFDSTDNAVRGASGAMGHFGFDPLEQSRSFQAVVNRNVNAKNEKSRS